MRIPQYKAGGVTGTFSGGVTFTPLRHEERDLLCYSEEGQAVLGPEQTTFTAHKLLLWDFSASQVGSVGAALLTEGSPPDPKSCGHT